MKKETIVLHESNIQYYGRTAHNVLEGFEYEAMDKIIEFSQNKDIIIYKHLLKFDGFLSPYNPTFGAKQEHNLYRILLDIYYQELPNIIAKYPEQIPVQLKNYE